MPLLVIPGEQPYLSRLSGAGSLRRELEQTLSVAEPAASVAAYRELVLDRNVTGKASASMRSWTWKRLRARYVMDPRSREFVSFRSCMERAHTPSDRGLVAYLMMARTDRLFREVATELLGPRLPLGDAPVSSEQVREAIEKRLVSVDAHWTPASVQGVVSHLLSACKDFGTVSGSVDKRVVRIRPGVIVTEFALRLGRLEGLTDRRALSSRWFAMLGAGEERAIELVYEAAQAGLLDFRFQADVAEIRLVEEVA